MEKYHVLVVEDDNEIANAIKIYLQNQKNPVYSLYGESTLT